MSNLYEKHEEISREAKRKFVEYLNEELAKIGVEAIETNSFYYYKYQGIKFRLIEPFHSSFINFVAEIPKEYFKNPNSDISNIKMTHGSKMDTLDEVKIALDKVIEDLKPYLKWEKIQLMNNNPNLDKMGLFEIKKFNEYE